MKMKLRLALREEGKFWNAYIARSDTMDGAMLIGSIIMGAVKKNLEVKVTFQAIMQQILADAVEDMTGKAPDYWDISSAPESERGGNA